MRSYFSKLFGPTASSPSSNDRPDTAPSSAPAPQNASGTVEAPRPRRGIFANSYGAMDTTPYPACSGNSCSASSEIWT